MKLFKKNSEPDMVEREDGLIDYDIYVLSKNEKILYTILAAIAIFAVGMIFYHSVILSLLISLFAFKFPKIRRGQIIEKRKRELNVQFKDLLYSLSSSMVAGRSLEMSFKDALKDLEVIYPDQDTPIIQEVMYIIRCLEMNMPVEQAIDQFAVRAHIEDIESFAEIIRICKRTGGNLVEVIRSTSQSIGEKIEIKQEIDTMIAGKKFEFQALMVMPVALILLLSMSSPDYMEPVFTTIIGRIVMTIAIGLFVAAYFVGSKIMKIKV